MKSIDTPQKEIATPQEAVKIFTAEAIAEAVGVTKKAVQQAMWRCGHLPSSYIKMRSAFPDYHIKDSVFGVEDQCLEVSNV